jgi:hypothetical protein
MIRDERLRRGPRCIAAISGHQRPNGHQQGGLSPPIQHRSCSTGKSWARTIIGADDRYAQISGAAVRERSFAIGIAMQVDWIIVRPNNQGGISPQAKIFSARDEEMTPRMIPAVATRKMA